MSNPQVSEAAAAGLGGIEHPGAIPGFVACRPWPVDPDIDVRQRAETLRGEQLPGARREGPVTLGQRDSYERFSWAALAATASTSGALIPIGFSIRKG